MALTSNETAWANTIVQILFSMAWGALLTWIAIKVKKPEDIKDIIAKARKILTRFLCWTTILFSLFILVVEYISDSPINRKDIFNIVWASCAIVASFAAIFIVNLLEMLTDYFKFQHEQFMTSHKFKQAVKEIFGSLPCFNEVSEKIIKENTKNSPTIGST